MPGTCLCSQPRFMPLARRLLPPLLFQRWTVKAIRILQHTATAKLKKITHGNVLRNQKKRTTAEMAGMNAARNAVFLDVRKSIPAPSPSLVILRSSAARKVCFTSTSRSSSEAQNAAEEARDGTPKVSDEAKETASVMSEEAKDSMRQAGEKASSAKEKAKENAEAGKQKVEENAESAEEKTSSASEAAEEKAKENVERAKEKTSSAAETVKEKTKEGASRATETAQDFGEKVKHTAQDAWGAAKETTQKIKETVVGKTESDLDEVERARRRASNDKKE